MENDEEILRHRVKAELRKRMRALRAAIPASACARRSERITKCLADLEPLVRSKTVALFWPIEDRHEVDLRPLDAILRERGVRLAYPAIDHRAGIIEFYLVADVNSMRRHSLGHREPAADATKAAHGELDLVVVPALAVDPTGQRIGYGAGYYDRALPIHVPPGTSIAVAFDFQLVVEVPKTESDVAVQWVVTDARALACTPAQ